MTVHIRVPTGFKKKEKKKKNNRKLLQPTWQKLSHFLLLTTTWVELQPVQQHLWPVHKALGDSRYASFWTATFSLSSEFGSIITFIIHQFYIYLPALRAPRYKIKILVAKLNSSELPAPKKPNLINNSSAQGRNNICFTVWVWGLIFMAWNVQRSIHKIMKYKA